MSAAMIGFNLLLIGLLLVMGKWIRVKTPLLQSLFLPSSLVAGMIALVFGPEILGRFVLLPVVKTRFVTSTSFLLLLSSLV
jgi:ESS family glutamate:Na+ symporter